MRKLVLALAVAFCSFQSWSQSDCGELLDHDQDGIIGAEDLLNLLSFFGQPLGCVPVAFDGYTYEVVEIGDQCWFAENLRTEHYTNGDVISADLSDEEWSSTSNGAIAVYGESVNCEHFSPDGDACDPTWSLNEYGRLYNWYAVDDARGLCPTGWHVPTYGEWTVMTDYLGGESVAGVAMQTTYGWYGNLGTNSSGFSGLPGGYRTTLGYDLMAGIIGRWYSSSPSDSDAWSFQLNSVSQAIGPGTNSQSFGYSVRCLKDAE